MIGKIVKYLALGIAFIIAGGLASALLYRAWLQHRVVTSRAIRSARGIQSLDRVHIGGIDQWIEVRGQNVSNPILLSIHGGPGVAFIPLAGSFQDPWEKHFTVLQWDQHGAGKTYASSDKELQHRTISVARMEQDALDIANYLRARFHRRKIFVLAHSWGSVLGLLAIPRALRSPVRLFGRRTGDRLAAERSGCVSRCVTGSPQTQPPAGDPGA